MKLAEARRRFELYKLNDLKREELEDMIDAAITVLHPSAKERLDEIRGIIRAAKGIDPFATRSRGQDTVCWRQCVWRRMRDEGYTLMEVGDASGCSHATVYTGVNRFNGYLSMNDRRAVRIAEEFNEMMRG